MRFVSKDRLSYRFPLCGSLRDFDSQLDVLSGRLTAPVAGLYTVYLPLGHAPDTPLESVAITPWRVGTTATGTDTGGYCEFRVYQVPTVETRRDDDLVVIASSPRIQTLRDYDVIEMEVENGAVDYMRPIILSIRAYWNDVSLTPVWLNVRQIIATLMFEGQTNIPDKVPDNNPAAIFEVFKGREKTQIQET